MRYRSRLSDEDAAFCAAQWASGITQREIAGHLGWGGSPNVCNAIEAFIRKFTDARVDAGRVSRRVVAGREERRALVKAAIGAFIARRGSGAGVR